MPQLRHFKWCADKINCKAVGIGKCDGHPDCKNGINCRFLKTRSCSYFHPHFHFEISQNHNNHYNQSMNKKRMKRHIKNRRHSSINKSSKSISPLSEKFVKAKVNPLNINKCKPWTESDEQKLISFFQNNNSITPIQKMDEIKNILNRDLFDIKQCLIRLKSEGKFNNKNKKSNIIKIEPIETNNILKTETKPWREWEENYLKSFVEKHNITDYFPSDKAEQIKTALNRKLADINITLDRLKNEGKIAKINANNIKIENQKRSFPQINKINEHKVDKNGENNNGKIIQIENINNINSINNINNTNDINNNNNNKNRKRKYSAIIENEISEVE
eukprot:399316_1